MGTVPLAVGMVVAHMVAHMAAVDMMEEGNPSAWVGMVAVGVVDILEWYMVG